MLRVPAFPQSELVATLREFDASPELGIESISPELLLAVALASPDLAQVLLGREKERGSATLSDSERTTIRRYLKRAHTRATPFGAFAGVAFGNTSSRTDVTLGERAIASLRTRADFSWLMGVLESAESETFPIEGARYLFNSLALQVGERVVLQSTDRYGAADNRTINVRLTSALRVVQQATSTPAFASEILLALAVAHPDADEDRLRGFLGELWTNRLLVSDSIPAQSTVRPDQRISEWMVHLDLPKSAQMAALVKSVDEIITVRCSANSVLQLRNRQLEVNDTSKTTLQVDAVLDARATSLNRAVADEVSSVSSLLTDLSRAADFGQSPMDRYHDRFLEEYGPACLVPVATAISALYGIDAPPDYTNPPRTAPILSVDAAEVQGLRSYERTLLEQLLTLNSGHGETLELTDELYELLARQGAEGRAIYPSVDALVEVVSESDRDLDEGRFQVVFRPESLTYGHRLMSRFMDILDPASIEQAYARAARLQEAMGETIVAELSYLPAYGRGANVAIGPRAFGYEVAVNMRSEHGPGHTISLDEVAVGSDGRHFYLWSTRHNRPLHVVQTHMLSLVAAPNVCRFLVEASLHPYVAPSGFTWGDLEALPSLPRVTRGRSVLRPAQWYLRRRDIWTSSQRSLDDEAESALLKWLAEYAVPRWVHLSEADNRLLIDCHNRHDLKDVLNTLRRDGFAVLQETFTPDRPSFVRDQGGRSYSSEAVFPLEVPKEQLQRISRSSGVEARRHGFAATPHYPGGDWTQINLYLPSDLQTDLICDRMQPYLERLATDDHDPGWFYIRYADPAHHVRLRIRTVGPPQRLAEVLSWAQSLVRDGSIHSYRLVPYRQEIARYGGPRVFDAVERFFVANSVASSRAMKLMKMAEVEDFDLNSIAVFALDTFLAQMGYSLKERAQLVPNREITEVDRSVFRDRREFLTQALVPWDERPNARVELIHGDLLSVFGAQARTAQDLAQALEGASSSGELTQDVPSILTSIMHMQVNRLMISGGDGERHVYALWKQTMRALTGRPDLRGRE